MIQSSLLPSPSLSLTSNLSTSPSPSFSTSNLTLPPPSLSDFEAHLQEVWSVRKNIHHKQNPITTNTGSKTSILQPGGIALTQADNYSRHCAIPTQNKDTKSM